MTARDDLALLLRRSARAHLGLKDGDHWPVGVADAQAAAVLAAGWSLTAQEGERGDAVREALDQAAREVESVGIAIAKLTSRPHDYASAARIVREVRDRNTGQAT